MLPSAELHYLQGLFKTVSRAYNGSMLSRDETLQMARAHNCRSILVEHTRIWKKHGIHLGQHLFTCDNPPAELLAALQVHGESIRHELPYDSSP